MTSRHLPKLGPQRNLRNYKRDHGFEILKKAHEKNQTTFLITKGRGTPVGLQKSHKAHILPNTINPWESEKQKSFDYLTCVITFDGTIALTTDRKHHHGSWVEIDLSKRLPVEPVTRGGLFEICASDVSLEHAGGCLAILAVFWVEIDTNNIPIKCFGTIFRITEKLDVIFCEVIATPSMVACCRLTDRKKFTGDDHCLLVFPRHDKVSAYRVEPNSIEDIDDVFDMFPSLALTNLPGGALRTSCKISTEFRYSAVGLDSGVLIVSVCQIEGNFILDSARLKFAGPMSVVEFLPEVSPSCQRILLSSYLGPGSIWRIHFENDKLRWEAETTFAGSQYQDSVLCGCIYRFYHGAPPMVLFGTFSGMILRYELPPPTLHVKRRPADYKGVPMIGNPIETMENHPIMVIKQTGLNEIGVLTPFGFNVLRESLAQKVRFSSLSYSWMESFQHEKMARHGKRKLDFTKGDIRRASVDSSIPEMRPRVGSTVSQLTNRTDEEPLERRRMTLPREKYTSSAPGSSNGSTSRLRQLDIATTDMFYHDGPPDMQSPSRSIISPRMNPIHESGNFSQPQSPLGSERRQTIFRLAAKKNDLPSPRMFK